MSESLVSTLTVSFDPDLIKDRWNNGAGLALERHIGFTGLKPGIPFRQYPQCPAKLVCSHGTISEIPELRVSDEKEVVVFSGSDTASLKRSLVTSVVVSVVSGVSFDENGDVVYPVVTYDSQKNTLVSDKKFYGAVSVSYKAPYLLYFYEFATEYDPISSATTIFGDDTIHAFYKKNHAELKMEMDFKLTSQWLPLYRVTTKIVLDELGVWEYPLNWDGVDTRNYSLKQDDPNREQRPTGVFPGWSTHEIDPDRSFTDERVHQTGEYDAMGRIRTYTPNEILSVNDPYWGQSDMSFSGLARMGLIKFSLKWATKPTWKKSMSYSEKHWFDAFLSIDAKKIREELEDDYPNIKFEGAS